MVQSEVADRMAADPGRKDYGAYTVKLRLLRRPAGRFAVARGCFLPPPRVDSRGPASRARPARRRRRRCCERRCAVADAAFAQRRKTLRNSLQAAFGDRRRAVDAALASAGIDGSVRAETLAPEAFVALATELAAATLGILDG